LASFGNVITLPKAANFYNGGLWGNSLPMVGFLWNFAPEFVLNLPVIEVSLSLIGLEVKIILPKKVHTGFWDTQSRDFFHQFWKTSQTTNTPGISNFDAKILKILFWYNQSNISWQTKFHIQYYHNFIKRNFQRLFFYLKLGFLFQ